ncbi:MAG TPA: hypothetical protein VFG00_02780, partial [Acidothermaceae bacterium]|nr:hypothetical protein [Acidothermaceae bacterium]
MDVVQAYPPRRCRREHASRAEPEHRNAAVEAMPDSLVRLVLHGVALTANPVIQPTASRLAALVAA